MLISSAILSRTVAVGVGFLLNSISKVVSWSCVARCRFWFFCCCVRVLLRGGRLDWLEPFAEGEGVSFLRPADTGVGTEVDELGVETPGAGVDKATGCSTSVAIVAKNDRFRQSPLVGIIKWIQTNVETGVSSRRSCNRMSSRVLDPQEGVSSCDEYYRCMRQRRGRVVDNDRYKERRE